jgi:hypothetical protein
MEHLEKIAKLFVCSASLRKELFETQSKVLDLVLKTRIPPGHEYNHLSQAVVCLHDAIHTAVFAGYAFLQASEHWSRKDYSEMERVLMSKYYLDDIALRLYPAAEDLARSIMFYLKIDYDDLEQERYTGLTQQVGVYLQSKLPDNPITLMVNELRTSEWDSARSYRNTWVHEQPPLCKGLGIQYDRSPPWSQSDELKAKSGANTWNTDFGVGSPPKIDMYSLVTTMRSSLKGMVTICSGLYNHFRMETTDQWFYIKDS